MQLRHMMKDIKFYLFNEISGIEWDIVIIADPISIQTELHVFNAMMCARKSLFVCGVFENYKRNAPVCTYL